jgi:hypothetical protein
MEKSSAALSLQTLLSTRQKRPDHTYGSAARFGNPPLSCARAKQKPLPNLQETLLHAAGAGHTDQRLQIVRVTTVTRLYGEKRTRQREDAHLDGSYPFALSSALRCV